MARETAAGGERAPEELDDGGMEPFASHPRPIGPREEAPASDAAHVRGGAPSEASEPRVADAPATHGPRAHALRAPLHGRVPPNGEQPASEEVVSLRQRVAALEAQLDQAREANQMLKEAYEHRIRALEQVVATLRQQQDAAEE